MLEERAPRAVVAERGRPDVARERHGHGRVDLRGVESIACAKRASEGAKRVIFGASKACSAPADDSRADQTPPWGARGGSTARGLGLAALWAVAGPAEGMSAQTRLRRGDFATGDMGVHASKMAKTKAWRPAH